MVPVDASGSSLRVVDVFYKLGSSSFSRTMSRSATALDIWSISATAMAFSVDRRRFYWPTVGRVQKPDSQMVDQRHVPTGVILGLGFTGLGLPMEVTHPSTNISEYITIIARLA